MFFEITFLLAIVSVIWSFWSFKRLEKNKRQVDTKYEKAKQIKEKIIFGNKKN